MDYYVNGRFLTKKLTGVERYATELLKALDGLLDSEPNAGNWTILAPEGTDVNAVGLRNIAVRVGGRGRGHLWEQMSLPSLAADGVLVNLANSGPIRHRRSFTVIHDAIVYRKPELFSFRYRSLHRSLGYALSRTSRLGTVSHFSRGELSGVLKIKPESIVVIPNGSDHLGQTAPDLSVLERFGLVKNRFFLFVGSPAPHKNVARALSAFASLGQTGHGFAIVGASQANVFGKAEAALPPGALATGRLSDAEVAALYANATAFVFPSLYEGFGIPPLEALSYGCRVLASNIPPVQEVCAEAATYFDPLSEADIARAMRQTIGEGEAGGLDPAVREARLNAFTWKDSAARLLSSVRGL